MLFSSISNCFAVWPSNSGTIIEATSLRRDACVLAFCERPMQLFRRIPILFSVQLGFLLAILNMVIW